MGTRNWFAFNVGVFGVYLLVHAAIASHGLNLANEALRPPLLMDSRVLPELHEVYPWLVATTVIFTTLSALSITACVGILRNCKWAAPLWLFTSAVALALIVVAVVFFEVAWNQYLYELVAICISFWCWLRQRGETYRVQ